MAEELDELADKVDKSVDNPLVPPHGNPGKQTSQPGGAVDSEAVNDFGVEKSQSGAEILDAIDEDSIVDFVDVILVNQKIVEAGPGRGNFGMKLRVLQVKVVGQPKPQDNDADGSRPEEIFGQQGGVSGF